MSCAQPTQFSKFRVSQAELTSLKLQLDERKGDTQTKQHSHNPTSQDKAASPGRGRLLGLNLEHGLVSPAANSDSRSTPDDSTEAALSRHQQLGVGRPQQAETIPSTLSPHQVIDPTTKTQNHPQKAPSVPPSAENALAASSEGGFTLAKSQNQSSPAQPPHPSPLQDTKPTRKHPSPAGPPSHSMNETSGFGVLRPPPEDLDVSDGEMPSSTDEDDDMPRISGLGIHDRAAIEGHGDSDRASNITVNANSEPESDQSQSANTNNRAASHFAAAPLPAALDDIPANDGSVDDEQPNVSLGPPTQRILDVWAAFFKNVAKIPLANTSSNGSPLQRDVFSAILSQDYNTLEQLLSQYPNAARVMDADQLTPFHVVRKHAVTSIVQSPLVTTFTTCRLSARGHPIVLRSLPTSMTTPSTKKTPTEIHL